MRSIPSGDKETAWRIVYSGEFPRARMKAADRMLTLARKGGIRQHLLGDTSRIRHGTIEDQSVDEYCNFLQTKALL